MSVVPQRPAAAVAALDSLSSAIAPVAANQVGASAASLGALVPSEPGALLLSDLHLTVHHQHVIIESCDHLRISAPLWLAGHCSAVVQKFERGDFQPDGSFFFPDVVGHALIRCLEFIEFEWPESFDYTQSKIPGPNKNRRIEKMADPPMRPKLLMPGGGGGPGESSICSFYVLNTTHAISADGSSTGAPHLVSVARPTETFEVFLDSASSAVLCELASASFYLDVKPLVELTCRAIANQIKGKSPEEIRTTFNIVNDFTPAEEEHVRQCVLERTMMLPNEVLDEPMSDRLWTYDAMAQRDADLRALQAFMNPSIAARQKLKNKLSNKKVLAGAQQASQGKDKDDNRNLEDLMEFIEQPLGKGKKKKNQTQQKKNLKPSTSEELAVAAPPASLLESAEPKKKKKKNKKKKKAGNSVNEEEESEEESPQRPLPPAQTSIISLSEESSAISSAAPGGASQAVVEYSNSDDEGESEADVLSAYHAQKSLIEEKIHGLELWEQRSAIENFLCICSTAPARPLQDAPVRDFSAFPFPALLSGLPRCVRCGFLTECDELQELLDLPALDFSAQEENLTGQGKSSEIEKIDFFSHSLEEFMEFIESQWKHVEKTFSSSSAPSPSFFLEEIRDKYEEIQEKSQAEWKEKFLEWERKKSK